MNELVRMDELQTLGQVFVKSGFFSDSRDASQAIVKILAGRELGFGAIASMTGVYIVQGRPALSANLIAAKIKSSGKYDYRIVEHDNAHCSIEFFTIYSGKRESLGISTFTLDDAKRAGTKNLDKFPRNMLFARALTNGARWHCPDIFNGAVYTPDELGAETETDQDGNIIKVVNPELAKEETQSTTYDAGIIGTLQKIADAYKRNPTEDQLKRMRGLLAGTLNELLGGDDKRHEFLAAVYPGCDGHIDQLPASWVGGMLNWLALEKREIDGKPQYAHSKTTDACRVVIGEFMREYQKQRGQTEMELTK